MNQTKFQILHKDYKENTTLLLCTPVTGRNHQIREHLIGKGFLIIGDESTSTKMQADYLEQRSEKATEIWSYKLDLFEKYGFSPDAEQRCLQDTILQQQEFRLPKDLNLFSYRYKVGTFDFRSELTIPDWISEENWQSVMSKNK